MVRKLHQISVRLCNQSLRFMARRLYQIIVRLCNQLLRAVRNQIIVRLWNQLLRSQVAPNYCGALQSIAAPRLQPNYCETLQSITAFASCSKLLWDSAINYCVRKLLQIIVRPCNHSDDDSSELLPLLLLLGRQVGIGRRNTSSRSCWFCCSCVCLWLSRKASIWAMSSPISCNTVICAACAALRSSKRRTTTQWPWQSMTLSAQSLSRVQSAAQTSFASLRICMSLCAPAKGPNGNLHHH